MLKPILIPDSIDALMVPLADATVVVSLSDTNISTWRPNEALEQRQIEIPAEAWAPFGCVADGDGISVLFSYTGKVFRLWLPEGRASKALGDPELLFETDFTVQAMCHFTWEGCRYVALTEKKSPFAGPSIIQLWDTEKKERVIDDTIYRSQGAITFIPGVGPAFSDRPGTSPRMVMDLAREQSLYFIHWYLSSVTGQLKPIALSIREWDYERGVSFQLHDLRSDIKRESKQYLPQDTHRCWIFYEGDKMKLAAVVKDQLIIYSAEKE